MVKVTNTEKCHSNLRNVLLGTLCTTRLTEVSFGCS